MDMDKISIAKSKLIDNWEGLVICGEMDKEEMIESLREQVNMDCQGWDASLEELDYQPELLEIMGYTEDLTDEQVDEWLHVVQDAAIDFLNKWEGK